MSTGTTGYPDGQRVQQNQSLDPLWQFNTPTSLQHPSGRLFIANYLQLLVVAKASASNYNLSVQWYPDSTSATKLGEHNLAIVDNINAHEQVLLPALGPYVQFTVIPQPSGVSVTPDIFVFATNSTWRHAALAPDSLLMGGLSTLTAAQALTIYPLQYGSGRMAIYTAGGTQQLKVELDYYDPTIAGWSPLDSYTVAAGARDYRERIYPTQPSRTILTNGSATTTSTGNQLAIVQEN